MARRYARIGFVGAVWLFVACAVGQVFLAGLGVFGLPAGLSALLLVLFSLQSVFVAIRVDYPSVAALHPLNGFLILLVAILLGRDGWRLVGIDRL